MINKISLLFSKQHFLTFRQTIRPSTAVLASDNRLTLHHIFWIAIELDNITGPIWCWALGVSIRRCSGIFALNLWEGKLIMVGFEFIEYNLGCRQTNAGGEWCWPFARWQAHRLGWAIDYVSWAAWKWGSAARFTRDNSCFWRGSICGCSHWYFTALYT